MLYLYVAIGGAFGALCRFGMVNAIHGLLGRGSFPIATMSVNIIGSLLMGLAIGLIVSMMPRGKELHALLIIGALGGFTTFSAFSYEAYLLIERGAWLEAGLYIFGSVILGVAAFFAGMWLFKVMA